MTLVATPNRYQYPVPPLDESDRSAIYTLKRVSPNDSVSQVAQGSTNDDLSSGRVASPQWMVPPVQPSASIPPPPANHTWVYPLPQQMMSQRRSAGTQSPGEITYSRSVDGRGNLIPMPPGTTSSLPQMSTRQNFTATSPPDPYYYSPRRLPESSDRLDARGSSKWLCRAGYIRD